MNVQCSSCHLEVQALGQDAPVYVLNLCGHICCELCRINWFGANRNTCPRCRKPQTEANIIRLYYDLIQPDLVQDLPSSSQVTAVEDDKDAVDEACLNFHKQLSENQDYISVTHRTEEFIDTLAGDIETHVLRRPLRLLGAALRQLSSKFQALQHESENLKSQLQRTKDRQSSSLFALREEMHRQTILLEERQQDLESNEAQRRQQTSSLHQKVLEAEGRLGDQASELLAKNVEIDHLRQSNLKWSKKYHALKQKVLQDKKRKKGDADDSLVII